MKRSQGEELESLYQTYSRLSHEFELANGYAWKSEITGVSKRTGIYWRRNFQSLSPTLSGGQKTRVSLGKLLLSKPDIILLDEPTNHLDMESIAWLENYLTELSGNCRHRGPRPVFPGSGGDEDDRTGQRHMPHVFQGNYSAYSEKKGHAAGRHHEGLLKPAAGDPAPGGSYHEAALL